MMKLVGIAIEKNQQKESEMMEYVKKEVDKYEKILKRVEKENQSEIQEITKIVGKRINQSFSIFEQIKSENEAALEIIKQ